MDNICTNPLGTVLVAVIMAFLMVGVCELFMGRRPYLPFMIKRQECLIRDLYADKVEIARIAQIVGVDEERVKEILKVRKKI